MAAQCHWRQLGDRNHGSGGGHSDGGGGEQHLCSVMPAGMAAAAATNAVLPPHAATVAATLPPLLPPTDTATAAIAFVFISVITAPAATCALPLTLPRCHQCSAAALPGWLVIPAVGWPVNWSVGWYQRVFLVLRGLDFWNP